MHLSREQVFDLWAPPSSPWSVWSKPVLFSFLPPVVSLDEAAPEPVLPSDLDAWKPDADGATVVIVDLPGVRSVQLGEALLHIGFRPVPLFNAVPGPWEERAIPADLGYVPTSLVDVYPIVAAIEQASPRLHDLLTRLPPLAPPAFLLDAERRLGGAPRPGDFDNRSVSLPTDFPSAAFLQSCGVTRAVVFVDARDPLAADGEPATDLAHTLLRWQAAGIEILATTVDERLVALEPKSIQVARPSWFGAVWHNALSLVGLRRSPLGGFGGRLSVPSSG